MCEESIGDYMRKRNFSKKSVSKIGYIGYDFEYVIRNEKSYILWSNMIKRCYGENKSKRDYVYDDCKVCEEWLSYYNFKKWYDLNYYNVENEKMNLDKDILNKGNRLYSPDTCVFAPREINTLFISSNRIRGEYPVGVHFNKKSKKIKAQIKKHNKVIYLGSFKTVEEAFNVYKENKESYIKEIAEKYKYKIPNNLYEAMLNYKIEITD